MIVVCLPLAFLFVAQTLCVYLYWVMLKLVGRVKIYEYLAHVAAVLKQLLRCIVCDIFEKCAMVLGMHS